MDRLNKGLYQLLDVGLQGDSWQGFIDRYNEKYNQFDVAGFEYAPTSLDYNFKQLLSDATAVSLPSWTDPESPGYEDTLRSITGKIGQIPTMKKSYRIDRVAVREKLQIMQQIGGVVPQGFGEIFVGLFDEGVDGLLQSYYNALTHERDMIVSTGGLTLDKTNNPLGSLHGVTINFLAEKHTDTIQNDKRWWTDGDWNTEGTGSDPLQYIKDRLKLISKKFHFDKRMMHIEMSTDMFDAFIAHSKVLTRVGHQMNALSATSDTVAQSFALNLSDEQRKVVVEQIIGVKIVIRDTLGFVACPGTDSDGLPCLVQNVVDNFKRENIAFVPNGKIGTIQGVQPLTIGCNPADTALYEGGRVVLSRRTDPANHALFFDMEATQLCVPSTQGLFCSTVAAKYAPSTTSV